jgi:hypothetical protein
MEAEMSSDHASGETPRPLARVSGTVPERHSHDSFAAFSDPDGKGWLLQEITTRLPGR